MNKLREVRVVRNVIQMRLGLVTGIHASKISLIENEFIIPRPEEMVKLAKALGVKVEEIFPESEAKSDAHR